MAVDECPGPHLLSRCCRSTRPTRWRAVDAAIAVIQDSGVSHEVGPMETTIEGDSLRDLLDIAARAHSAAVELAGGPVQTNVRMIESPAGIASMHEKTSPFREGADG